MEDELIETLRAFDCEVRNLRLQIDEPLPSDLMRRLTAWSDQPQQWVTVGGQMSPHQRHHLRSGIEVVNSYIKREISKPDTKLQDTYTELWNI